MPTLVHAITGAPFTADAARAEVFKSSNGARGVTLPTDLKVTALPTPGAFVRVRPGGATLPAGYPSAPGQSYGTYEPGSVDVPVPATGSGGGVTRYLIQRVVDPQFEGQPPADPLTANYADYRWVSSLTNLNYPYVELVKLVQPASTATITNAMLTDIRKLTRPRTQREQFMNTGGSGSNLTTVSPGFQNWPATFMPTVPIPEWATHVRAQMNLFGPTLVNGTTYGVLRLHLGTLVSSLMSFDFNTPGYWYNGVRVPAIGVVLGDVIPEEMRGTNQVIKGQGNKQGAEAGYMRSDSLTQIEFDVWFTEKIL